MDIVKRLGTYGVPLMYLAAGFTIYQQFADMIPKIGIKALSAVTVVTFFGWASFYLSSFHQSEVLLQPAEKQVLLTHTNRLGRLYAYIVPALLGVLAIVPWLQRAEPDYSDYFKQGSGLGEWIVVFDSEPPGATVRLTNYLKYKSDDPFLEKTKDVDREDKTPFAARLYQGQYWVVFKWNGKFKTKRLMLSSNQVVKVVFSKKWLPDLGQHAILYMSITFFSILITLRLLVEVLQKKKVFVIKETAKSTDL